MPSRQLSMFVLFNSGPTLTFYCVHEQRAKKFRQSVQMSWWLEWAQCNLPGPSGVEGDMKVQLGPETSRRLFFFTPFSPSGTDSLSFPQHGAKPQGTKTEKKKKKSRLGGWDKKQEEEGKEREVLRHKILPGWCGGADASMTGWYIERCLERQINFSNQEWKPRCLEEQSGQNHLTLQTTSFHHKR